MNSETENRELKVLVWGTYDTSKPRVRILLQGLRETGIHVSEVHREVWLGVEDKSQIHSIAQKLLFLSRWMKAYPALLFDFLRTPRPDIVLIPYLGQLDVLLLWPFSRIRKVPVCWDAFLSLYDTIVNDRRLVGAHHPLARLLWRLEWMACRAADQILLDTNAHAHYFVETFGVSATKIRRVFVGAEDIFFRPPAAKFSKDVLQKKIFTVLFYGQFIPLHGIETIVRAAKLCDHEPIHWVLIGKGQEAPYIRTLVNKLSPRHLEWIEWVPYQKLVDYIQDADVCLGIFGDTGKAARVIPNKIYQVLAAGRPLITRDSPAVRELLFETESVILIPCTDSKSLAAAVKEMRIRHCSPALKDRHSHSRHSVNPSEVGNALRSALLDIRIDINLS